MKQYAKKSLSLFLAAITLISVFFAGTQLGSVKADAASWNGTNYGGGSVAGYRTFLEAFGIDYDTYMKWMDDHDADSPNPNYYLGTRYVGYDHRNPNGDCSGAYGYYDSPGTPALNCTGFVWHVLYKSAVHSGASRSQINSLPVMGSVTPTWANLGVYRIYFRTKEEALASGILEKGDLLWMYGTKDNHNAIFYGESSDHDRYWHSAGPNSYGRIDAPGDFLGMWVAKVTQPNNILLAANPSNILSNSFGAKYCVFTSKSDAEAARRNPSDMNAWDKRIGTIALNSSGKGYLRTQAAPSQSELWVDGKAQTNLSYFSANAKKVSAKNKYYALQWSTAKGALADNTIYEFTDSGKRTSTGYRIFGFKVPKRVATPAFTNIVSTTKGVKLSWNAVPNADKYRVYYKNTGGGWTRFGETASTSFTDEIVTAGNRYVYTIRCVDKDGDFTSDYNKNGWAYTYTGVDTPKFSSLTSEAEGIRLKWNPISGAAKYRLYYKGRDGSWKNLGETASTEFVDDIVTIGNTYTYTIRALNNKGRLISGYIREGSSCKYEGVATPQITRLENTSKGIQITWDKVPGAKNYRVFYRANGSWQSLGNTSNTTMLDSDVKAGNTYTYTVRCVGAHNNYISYFNADGTSIKFVR